MEQLANTEVEVEAKQLPVLRPRVGAVGKVKDGIALRRYCGRRGQRSRTSSVRGVTEARSCLSGERERTGRKKMPRLGTLYGTAAPSMLLCM